MTNQAIEAPASEPNLTRLIESKVDELRIIARDTARTLDNLLVTVPSGLRCAPPREWVREGIDRIATNDARADELLLYLTTKTDTGTLRLPSLRGVLP